MGMQLPTGMYYLMISDRENILYRRKVVVQN